MKQFLVLLVAFLSFNVFAGTVYFPISTSTLSAPSGDQVLYYNSASSAMNYSDVIDLMSAATSGNDGYLTSTDWSTFNGKQDSLGFTAEDSANKIDAISGTSSASYTSEKAVVDYVGSEISGLQVRVSGTCASSYAINSIAADGTVSCEEISAGLSASAPVEINSNVISMSAAASGVDGYLTASDWSTFNGKQDTLSAASDSVDGYLAMGDWSTFNGKVGSVDAGTGISISGSATAPVINVVASAIQTRVSGTCAGAIGVVNENGTVSCRTIPTIGRYVQDLTFNGTDLTKTVSVSATITDARNAIIQLKQNANDFEVTGVSLKAPDAANVTISTTVALPAGDYKLIVLE